MKLVVTKKNKNQVCNKNNKADYYFKKRFLNNLNKNSFYKKKINFMYGFLIISLQDFKMN